MSHIVRFAPSPTGYIHLGNLRTALLNWCQAKGGAAGEGGRFILRFDDTDTQRSRAEYADAILADLAWVGVTPDLVVRQSDRLERYEAAAARLRDLGRLYPCYETPDELDRRRRRQLARGLPPVYDRAALKLTEQERAALEREGRRPHWRFRLDARDLAWEDGVRGPAHVQTASLSDPVLIREDGSHLYTFASVVDDIDLDVTLVLRGEDHVTNTAIQVELFEALGREPPAFAHHNLLVDAAGDGFSKREGSMSIRALREAGYEAMTVAALALLTGTSEPVRPVSSLTELCGLVSLDAISRAPAHLSPAELDALNARLLHQTPYAAVAERLHALGVGGGEAFWTAARANLVKFPDAAEWWRIVAGGVEPVTAAEDRDVLATAAGLLPPEPWDGDTFGRWTAAVREATGRKGRALFMPLRLALTGLDHGPELAALLPLIGRDRAEARLRG